jgi:hypothetical protein
MTKSISPCTPQDCLQSKRCWLPGDETVEALNAAEQYAQARMAPAPAMLSLVATIPMANGSIALHWTITVPVIFG